MGRAGGRGVGDRGGKGGHRVSHVRGVAPCFERACQKREVARIEEVEEERVHPMVGRACDAPEVPCHSCRVEGAL